MDDILADIRDCINDIYDRMSKEGYEITSMATNGFSAGGHLALLYGYKCPNAAKIPVKAVFSQVGPADFHKESWKPGIFQYQLPFLYFANILVPGYNDMSAEEQERRLNEMSPLYYVNEKTVPTVMTYGAEDILVGHEHGEKLNAKLNQYGVDHTYLTMTKSNHTAEMDSSTIQKFWVELYNLSAVDKSTRQ